MNIRDTQQNRKFGCNLLNINNHHLKTQQIHKSLKRTSKSNLLYIQQISLDIPQINQKQRQQHYLKLIQQDQQIPLNQNSKYFLSIREKTVNWMIQLQILLQLKLQTLELCILTLDRISSLDETFFLQNESISQLTAITSLFIASKYKQIYSPSLSDFIYVTRDKFDFNEIIMMQRCIIDLVKCKLTVPLISNFYGCLFLKKPPSDLLIILSRKQFIGKPKQNLAFALWILQNGNINKQLQKNQQINQLAKMMYLVFNS